MEQNQAYKIKIWQWACNYFFLDDAFKGWSASNQCTTSPKPQIDEKVKRKRQPAATWAKEKIETIHLQNRENAEASTSRRTFILKVWRRYLLTAYQHHFAGANSKGACATRLKQHGGRGTEAKLLSKPSLKASVEERWHVSINGARGQPEIWSHTCAKTRGCPPLLLAVSLELFKRTKNEGATLQRS